MSERNTKKSTKDRLIPWYFVIFFAVIALLDGIFVYKAISTQTGVVTENAYEKGLNYNKILEDAKQNNTADIAFEYTGHTARVVLSDSGKQPISGADITIRIVRPVQDGYDTTITLPETGKGLYTSELTLPLQGLWEARIHAQWENKQKNLRKATTFIAK